MTTRRSPRHVVRHLAMAALLTAAVGGCTQLADVLTPGERGGSALPASIALNASVVSAQLSPSDIVTLSAVVSYVRQDESLVRITSVSRPLSGTELQAVPIGVDVAACLADPERNGGDGSCFVVLELTLSVNGNVVDAQRIGPLRLTPGQPANVPGTVTLFDIAEIEVQDAAGNVVPLATPLTLTVGDSRALRAVVRDTRGAVVTERTPVWSSEAPAVAAITEGGDVTAVSAGAARFVATLGARTVAVSANVQRPTVALEIVGASGSGRGVVQSTPAGIDCRVNGSEVSGACSFAFDAGTKVMLRSTPDSDNRFAEWGDECVNGDAAASCEIELGDAPESRKASARFTALRRLTINAASAGSGRGRVLSAQGLDCAIDGATVSGTCSVQVDEGSTVSLEAIAAPASEQTPSPRFAGWSGAACASSETALCEVPLIGNDQTVAATFVARRVLTVDLTGSGDGLVRSTPEGIECRVTGGVVSGTCQTTFDADEVVTLQSTPENGNLFATWGEGCAASEGESACVIRSSTSGRASARFVALRRVVIRGGTSASGRGRVTGTAGLDCLINGTTTSGVCAVQVPEGTTITLEAAPEAEASGTAATSEFRGWGSECTVSTADRCVFTVSGSDQVVRADFVDRGRLTVSVNGTGAGLVRSGNGIACARTANGATTGECNLEFTSADPITLEAVAEPGSEFTGFGGDCASASGNVCTLTTTSSRTVTATFARKRVRLTIIVDGGRLSSGAVSLNGSEACTIAFGDATTTCARGFDAGTQVIRVAATPGSQSLFTGFGGDCSGTGTCAVTMSADRTVRVTFAATPRAVNVVRSATASGSGRVQSVDVSQRIDCAYTQGQPAGSGCRTTVPPLTNMRLTATPAPASALLSWGDACAGTMTLTCALSPTAASTDVSARFVSAIDVQMVLGGGAGTVSFSIPNVPSQGVCTSTASAGNSCRFSLPVGSTGVFRASPAAGVAFAGFQGPCLEGTGLVQTCTYRGFGFVREIKAFFGSAP